MKDIKPIISVLIPAYNTAQYIGECIESVIRQTYGLLEIIIVDDGSTDNTAGVVRDYMSMDNRIKFISIPHGGVAEARNVCLQYATGEYILFVDSDDWIGENLCMDLITRAIVHNAAVVFSAMTIISNHGDPILFGDRSHLFNGSEVLKGKDCFIKMVESGATYPMVAGNLYQKCLIERNKLSFDGQYHEDEYFTPQLLKYAQRVCNLRKSSYFYRQRQNSIMHEEKNKKERAIVLTELADNLKSLLLKDSDCQEYNQRYFQAVYRHVQSLKDRAKRLYDERIVENEDLLLIFIEQCIGTQYGIGTYVRELVSATKDSSMEVLIVELCSTGNQSLTFGSLYHQPCIKFPYNHSSQIDNDIVGWIKYQKSVSFYLANKFETYNNVICHFNMFGYDEMAKILRKNLNAKIVFTLHYTDWSFSLLGNKEDLIRRLQSDDCESDPICINFKKERSFLHECCDHIIAVAKHTSIMLTELYHIPQSKVSLIYNSIVERVRCDLSKNALREIFGFQATDKIIIFVGRIEKVKGILELIRAFKIVYKKDNNARLLIVGTGAFSSIMEEANPVWSRITITGFVNKDTLYQLYNLSDLGIVPSIYEEFGYVALEMALSGLPVLVNDTGGLHELTGIVSLIRPIKSSIFDPQRFAIEIVNCMNHIVSPTFIQSSREAQMMVPNFQESINAIYNCLRI